MVKFVKIDCDEIIRVKAGRLTRNYKGYKGTFAGIIYNCGEKKELPGFYYEEDLISALEHKDASLTLTVRGKRTGEELMGIMDIVMANSSAFPAERGKAQYSITIKGSGK